MPILDMQVWTKMDTERIKRAFTDELESDEEVDLPKIGRKRLNKSNHLLIELPHLNMTLV